MPLEKIKTALRALRDQIIKVADRSSSLEKQVSKLEKENKDLIRMLSAMRQDLNMQKRKMINANSKITSIEAEMRSMSSKIGGRGR